jgi:hypothetical protein
VRSGFRLCRRRACFAAAALLALALASLALGGCAAVIDTNEPNDGLDAASELAAGTPAQGVIGPGDSDVFACDAPVGGAVHAFTVTVRTEAPQDIELQVGASIPGVWEGITWPGWKAVTRGDRVEVAGTLRKGTVLMFLKGTSGTVYTIGIVWR